MRRSDRVLLGACFFVSGATSLVLEVAWTKELSYILGNTLYAVSTAVGAFMAGLGLGSVAASRWADRFRRPVLVYAGLQLGIALFGFTLIHLFRASQPLFATLYRSLGPGGGAFLLARFAGTFFLLLLPTTLMGMTLPVIVGAFARRTRQFEMQAGLLYGINTVGAVLGTLLAGFALLPWLGIRGTCLAAGSADLVIAGVAALLARRLHRTPEAPPATTPQGTGWNSRQWRIALLYGASGFLALVYEVAWFRLSGLTLGPSVYAFSAVLAVYLAGIGIGSATVTPMLERYRLDGLRGMATLEGALGLITLLQLYALNTLPGIHSTLFRWTGSLSPEGGFAATFLLFSAIVVFVPCLLMGALFPLTVRAVREAGPPVSPETHVGRIYLLNTAGSIVGSLAAGFWLLPSLGLRSTLGLASLGSLALGSAFLVQVSTLRSRGSRLAMVGGGLGVGLALLLAAPGWNAELFNLGLYRDTYAARPETARARPEKLIFYREGINCPVAVYRTNGNAALFLSGKPDAGLGRADQQTQLLLGHLPVSFSRNPERVAMIGYGCGMTAAAILAHDEVKHLDVLEIEQAVIDASPYFECVNQNPFDDPRTRLILEDGRIHLSYTGQTYDVIISEPSNPWMAGVANLFTVDFYGIARDRLAEGGIFCQWLQEYDISEESFRGMLGSLQDVFPHVALFRPTPGDFLALASEAPLSLPWGTFESRFEQPRVKATYARIDLLNPLQIGFFFQGCESAIREYASGAGRRNTDDNVWLEYRLPRELMGEAVRAEAGGGAGRRITRLGSACKVHEWIQLLPGVPLIPSVQEITLYPYGLEPGHSGGAVDDPWRSLRGELLEGLVRELRSAGREDLAVEIVELDARGREYMERRNEVYERLRAVMMGETPPTSSIFAWALAEAPDLPYLHAFLGDLAGRAQRFEEAEEYYDQVLRTPAGLPYYEALLGMTRLDLARGRTEEAERWCRRAVEWNPYFSRAHLILADVLLASGDRAGARAAVHNGLLFNPEDSELLARRNSG